MLNKASCILCQDSDWQLLEAPITLEEFEALPFVRSVFFHFGMQFDRTMPAVLETNDRGGIDIRIRIPERFENDLVFFYQLRFADTERKLEATYRGAALERFVYQTTIDNTAMFSVHVPTTGEYYFEIFANKIDDTNKISLTEEGISPFRLKCACKFKIRCKSLKGKMHPLPDCASGEWGPKKATRHFRLKPVFSDHSDNSSDTGSSSSSGDSPENPKAGIFNVEDSINLKFRMPMPLQFVVKLKMNHVEQKALDPFVYHTVENNVLNITATMPQLGQYGLDLYAKPKESEAKTLSHACKYLLNAVRVSNPVELPKVHKSSSRRGTAGPAPGFDELGIKLVSHPEPKITLDEKESNLKIDMEVPTDIEVSYQMMREPDEDCKEFAKLVRDTKDPSKITFDLHLAKHGNFMLCIYAKRKWGDEMPNVFNYVINHKKKNPLFSSQNGSSAPNVVFEEKKSTGLLRKSIFGGKKKEKEKEKKK